jgi:putative serine protease PepD
MTEQTPPFNRPEDTNVLPPYAQQPHGTEPSPNEPVSPRTSKGRARTATFLTAALLLGAGGGVAGAAAYDTLDDETTTTSTSDGGNTGAVAPLTTDTSGNSQDAPAADGSAEAVAKSVLPSVVKITVIGSGGSGGSGSGIILSQDGEILTNDHVAEAGGGNAKMTVSFNDGTTADATVEGTDPVTDLAIIKAEGVSGLSPARIGDSDALDVGEGVVAIGSPFGLEATVTSGIVSSLNRPVAVGGENGGDTIYPAIQTDAAINPGNSGGPLVNLKGQVIGVNSSIRTSSSSLGGEGGSIGLGFAIPISKVLPVVEQLRNGETPTHARLGVTVSNKIEDGLATGAGIESVEAGSAGDAAGLKSGDVVLKVDDEVISSVDSLVATIRGYRPGDDVKLTVMRDGKTITIDATLDSDVDTTQS